MASSRWLESFLVLLRSFLSFFLFFLSLDFLAGLMIFGLFGCLALLAPAGGSSGESTAECQELASSGRSIIGETGSRSMLTE